ncbi:cyclin-dependent kinase complex component, partial [Fusarium albosuccineum]
IDFADLDDDPFFGADFNSELGSPVFLDERTSPDWHELKQDEESNPYPLAPEPARSMVGTNFNAQARAPDFFDKPIWPNWYGSDQDVGSHSHPLAPEQPAAIVSPRVTVSMWGNEAPVHTGQRPFEYKPPTALGGFQPAGELLSATEHAGLVPENRVFDESPSINELAARCDDDGRKGMVEIWMDDETTDMPIRPSEKSDKSADLRDPPDVPEDQNPSDHETKDERISERPYYSKRGEMSEQDMDLIMPNRNWGDAPLLHSASRGQPKTSQAAMKPSEILIRSTDTIYSTSGTWNRRRRSLPSLAETDVLTNSGSGGLLKKISLGRGDQESKPGGLLKVFGGLLRRPKPSQFSKRIDSNVHDEESRPTPDLSSAVFKYMQGPSARSSNSLTASATTQAGELNSLGSWSNSYDLETRLKEYSYDLETRLKESVDITAPPKNTPEQTSSSNQPEPPEAESKMVEFEYDISLSRGSPSTIQNGWKIVIEHIAGCRLSWWPLPEPEDELQQGYTRFYSMSFAMPSQTQQRFYDDIPTSLAETMFPKLVDARRSTQRSGRTVLAPEAVLLRDTTLMHLLHRRGDGDARQQLRNRSDKICPAETGDTEGGDQRPQGPGDQSIQERDNQMPVKSRPILFISSDVTSNESVAGTVELGENDATTVRNLQEAFRRLPSRGWKRATGIKFYRFQSFHFKPSLKRRYVVVDKDKERYPEEGDPEYVSYNYDPRPWEDGKPCPCLSGEAWFFFKNPDECCSSKQLNRALPVRLNDTNDSRITAWGIHIEQRHSAWAILIPAIALAIVTLAATFWFIPRWLKDHPGDLQNATVPAILAFSVMQLLIQLLASLLIFRWSV